MLARTGYDARSSCAQLTVDLYAEEEQRGCGEMVLASQQQLDCGALMVRRYDEFVGSSALLLDGSRRPGF